MGCCQQRVKAVHSIDNVQHKSSVLIMPVSRDFFKVDGTALAKFFKLFSAKEYNKTTLISFLAMGNSSLLTKFQLDMFIFEELATDQTLLQSLKQNSNCSAHSGRNFSSSTRTKSFL